MEDQSTTEPLDKKKESLGKVTKWLKEYYERLNLRSAFAGVFVSLGLILLSKLITVQVNGAGLSGFISQTSAAVSMGASTGHFFGMALRKEGDLMTSFLLGGSATLAIALLGIVGISITGGILLTFTVGVFLMHNSGLVANHERIEGYVKSFSENGSSLVLTSLALWEYITPLIKTVLSQITTLP